MKGYSPVHDHVLGAFIHVEIHLFVHQTEDYGFIPHQRLIVTLCVTNRLLLRTLYRKLMPHLSGAPIFVSFFFNPFYPVISNSHSHPETEAYAIFIDRRSQTGHAADIFSNRNGRRLDLFYEHVSKSQVRNCVLVHALVEIKPVVPESLLQAVIPVQHARDAVEPEPVQMIFLNPELAVAEQEAHGLGFPVIEASGPPCRMMTLRPMVEIQVIPAVE